MKDKMYRLVQKENNHLRMMRLYQRRAKLEQIKAFNIKITILDHCWPKDKSDRSDPKYVEERDTLTKCVALFETEASL